MDYSILLSLIVSTNYVLSIYIKSKGTDRNDPNVVRQRLINVSMMTIVNCVIVICYLHWTKGYSIPEILFKLGFLMPMNLKSVVEFVYELLKIILLLNVLYMGPILDEYITEGNPYSMKKIISQFDTIYNLRDHLIGPVTEEITYTSLLITISVPYSFGPSNDDNNSNSGVVQYCLFKSLYFGIAHIHHAYHLLNQEEYQGRYVTVFVSCFIQFMYTTVFGTYTNLQFVQSGGNLLSCILAHVICNVYGLPQAPQTMDSKKHMVLLSVGLVSFIYLARVL